MTACYVYYRVQPARERDAEEALRGILSTVQRATGIQGRWLRKVGEPLLWMEIYEHIEDLVAFKATLAEISHSSPLGAMLQTGAVRHEEYFLECA